MTMTCIALIAEQGWCAVMVKHDYRDIKELKSYVYDPDTSTGDYELCPNCCVSFKTSNIEVVDMEDGDCDYGICPHCGVLLKLYLVPTYYFDPVICSVEEFEKEACVKLSEVGQ